MSNTSNPSVVTNITDIDISSVSSSLKPTTSNASEKGSSRKTKWLPEHENILIEWADKALCYKWMHTKANLKFTYQNAWFTIPVIIISTITGTANFAQERFGEDMRATASMIIGGFNLFAGILTTIQQFLKITELNESHRVSVISWDKFHRNIKVELVKPPFERMDAKTMLKIYKEEFDRLMETSPIIPEEVAERFKTTFSGEAGYKEIKKPDICGELIPTGADRYNDSNVEVELRNTFLTQNEQDEIQMVHKFRNQFIGLRSREPFVEEVVDNLGKGFSLSRSRIEELLQAPSVNVSIGNDDSV